MTSATDSTAPLGLFGGTFDPIHSGHLRLAEEAREALGLARVRFIPSGVPPHRNAPGSSSAHRLEMVHLAIADNPAFECDDQEVACSDKSYTVRTLERLRAKLGATRPLVLILGADAFEGLARWHRWRELFDLTHIAVANRPGHGADDPENADNADWSATLPDELADACRQRITRNAQTLAAAPAGCVVPFTMTPLAISATLIRDLVGQNRSPRYLLADSVLDYISQHTLYR